MVSLVQSNYFDKYIRPVQGPAEGLEDTVHNVFDRKEANVALQSWKILYNCNKNTH